jgi:hypothetical protein
VRQVRFAGRYILQIAIRLAEPLLSRTSVFGRELAVPARMFRRVASDRPVFRKSPTVVILSAAMRFRTAAATAGQPLQGLVMLTAGRLLRISQASPLLPSLRAWLSGTARLRVSRAGSGWACISSPT